MTLLGICQHVAKTTYTLVDTLVVCEISTNLYLHMKRYIYLWHIFVTYIYSKYNLSTFSRSSVTHICDIYSWHLIVLRTIWVQFRGVEWHIFVTYIFLTYICFEYNFSTISRTSVTYICEITYLWHIFVLSTISRTSVTYIWTRCKLGTTPIVVGIN